MIQGHNGGGTLHITDASSANHSMQPCHEHACMVRRSQGLRLKHCVVTPISRLRNLRASSIRAQISSSTVASSGGARTRVGIEVGFTAALPPATQRRRPRPRRWAAPVFALAGHRFGVQPPPLSAVRRAGIIAAVIVLACSKDLRCRICATDSLSVQHA